MTVQKRRNDMKKVIGWIIAIVIVTTIIVAGCISAMPDDSTSENDAEENVTSTDPIEAVIMHYEEVANSDEVLLFEFYGAMIDEEETAYRRGLMRGIDDALTDEYLDEHFVIVYVEYYVEYDNYLTPLDGGYQGRYVYMMQDDYGWWQIDDYSNQSTFKGIFYKKGAGNMSKFKYELESTEAALEALEAFEDEDYILSLEVCDGDIDYTKTNEILKTNTELVTERGWNTDGWIRENYTFAAIYAECYIEYNHDLVDAEDGYTGVVLWMEKDLDTGEWSCYKADTDLELEFIYVDDPNVQMKNSEYEEDAQDAVFLVIESLKDGDEIVSVEIYGSKIESNETQITLDKATVLIYTEYCVEHADGVTNDNAVYFWMERDADSGEWSCYSTVDVTTSDYEFLYK